MHEHEMSMSMRGAYERDDNEHEKHGREYTMNGYGDDRWLPEVDELKQVSAYRISKQVGIPLFWNYLTYMASGSNGVGCVCVVLLQDCKRDANEIQRKMRKREN